MKRFFHFVLSRRNPETQKTEILFDSQKEIGHNGYASEHTATKDAAQIREALYQQKKEPGFNMKQEVFAVEYSDLSENPDMINTEAVNQ